MNSYRRVIRKSPFYGFLKKLWAVNRAKQWTIEDQRMLVFYSQFIKPGDLCFDVGANDGNRTKIFLKLGAKVVTIEPQEECVKSLRAIYSRNPQVVIIPEALGAKDGDIDLMIGNASVISSISEEWINAVKASNRFPGYSWEQKQTVQMTTLDRVIREHGIPSFIKIDVEGYEFEVLKGLSQPVNALSIEFVPEVIDTTIKCIDHLNSLGILLLNYSLEETMQFALDHWVTSEELFAILSSLQVDNNLWGDVYVKFTQ
jgi:FkbM family methyltransferase